MLTFGPITNSAACPPNLRLLTRGSWSESQRFAEILRKETVGGMLLLVAAGAALVWANSPWAHAYRAVSEFAIGPESLHLRLTVSAWAADGLLAIFFFVVGLELKREFVAGDLRDPRRAALPIAAAVGGMVVPAAIYIGDQSGGRAPRESRRVGGADRHRHRVRACGARGAVYPPADCAAHLSADPCRGRRSTRHHRHRDLLSPITCHSVPLALALIPIGLFGLAVQRGIHHWWVLVPLAAVAWALVHASGVHATVAGVLLGFTVPVLGRHGHPTAELLRTHLAAGVRGLRGARVRVFRRRRDGRRLVRSG